MPVSASTTAARIAVLALLAAGIPLASCSSEDSVRTDAREGDDAPAPTVPPRNPREQVLDLMDAKLAYAQAVLQGVVLADFVQIEHNAEELESLSRQSRFMVDDSMAYEMLGERFRSTVRVLAEDAADEDLVAVTNGYTALVSSCVDCHRHLQAERTGNDMPGQLSLLDPARIGRR